MKPSPSYAVPLNRRHDRDEVYTAALQYHWLVKNTLLYKFMHFYQLKHSVVLSLIHQQWLRALYWPTCHCRPPECTCSQFAGIWNLSPTNLFAKPDFKDCFLQSICWNLKFVTSSILFGKLLTKEFFYAITHTCLDLRTKISSYWVDAIFVLRSWSKFLLSHCYYCRCYSASNGLQAWSRLGRGTILHVSNWMNIVQGKVSFTYQLFIMCTPLK